MPVRSRVLVALMFCTVLAVPFAGRSNASVYSADRLAYVYAGKLHIQGTVGSSMLIAGPGNAFHPAFSNDGRWLAWVQEPATGPAQLWLAHGDGSGAHRLAFVDDFAWSPTADVLAVQSAATNRGGQAMLIRPNGQRHVIWAGEAGALLWSPDGRALALTTAASGGVPSGVESPQWTRDGHGVLFVKDGQLWIDSHLGAGNPHPLVRLVPAHSVPDYTVPAYQGWYYGHMDWHELYAWY